MNLQERFKNSYPYLRHIGYDAEMMPLARLIIFNNWNIDGFNTTELVISNEVKFKEAREFDLSFRTHDHGTVDDLLNLIDVEIKKNKDRILKEKLIEEKLKAFEEKLQNSDLQELESLNFKDMFTDSNELKNPLTKIKDKKNEPKETS